MKILRSTPDENGAYPALQDYSGIAPPSGFYWWPDSLETSTFQQYNGFIVPVVVRSMVKSYTANAEAWEAWKATLPPDPGPEPSGDYVTYGELAAAIREGVNLVD